jgi:hypothetical protein
MPVPGIPGWMPVPENVQVDISRRMNERVISGHTPDDFRAVCGTDLVMASLQQPSEQRR